MKHTIAIPVSHLWHLVLKLICPQKLKVPEYSVPESTSFGRFIVGRARTDITPPPGYPMGGHSIGGKVSRGLWTRLYARAFYFIDVNGHSLALVSCDLFAIPGGLRYQVCRLAAEGGVPLLPDELILAATHTHHGPGSHMTSELYSGFSGPWPGFDAPLFHFLARQIAAAVIAAFQDAKNSSSCEHTVTLRVGAAPNIQRNRAINAFFRNPPSECQALIDEGISKGMRCPDGTKLNCFRYLAADPTLTVLEVLRKAGGVEKRIALLVFFSVHPTAMTHDNELWSSDLTGRAMMSLEHEAALQCKAELDCKQTSELKDAAPDSLVAGFFNGAEGDVSPRWISQNRDEVIAFGDQLADAVRKVLADSQGAVSTDTKVSVSSKAFQIGGRGENSAGFDSKPEFGVAAVGGAEDGRSLLYYYGWHSGVFADKPRNGQGCKLPALDLKSIGILHLLNLTHTLAPTQSFPCQFPVSIARIGDILTIGAIPVELTSMMGRRIRAVLESGEKPRQFVLVGLANEYLSYATTPEEYDAQDYEGASTIFGREESNRICQLLRCVARRPGTTVNDSSSGKRVVPSITFKMGLKLFSFGPEFQADRPRSRKATRNSCQLDIDSVALIDEDLLPNFPGSLFRLNSRAPRFEWTEEAATDWCTEKRKVSIYQYEEEHNRWVPLSNGWFPESDEGADILTVLLEAGTGERRWEAIWLPPKDINKTKQYLFRVETGAGDVRCSEPFDLRNLPAVEPSPPRPRKGCPPGV
jgi:neutral ceramidase